MCKSCTLLHILISSIQKSQLFTNSCYVYIAHINIFDPEIATIIISCYVYIAHII